MPVPVMRRFGATAEGVRANSRVAFLRGDRSGGACHRQQSKSEESKTNPHVLLPMFGS
jgi:hypothetical protein